MSFLILLIVVLAVLPEAYAQAALQFVPMTPCRVVDTRNPAGPFGGPSLSGGVQRDFVLPQGSCNIPATAAAYSLNVTVVPQGKLSYLTVWPTGQTRPVISTLNSVDGRVKANAAIVPAGTSGGVSVYATNTTDLVLDIDGYFVPATSSTLAFFPLTPCRVADTRWAQGPLGGPHLIGAEERDFPVLSSSCNIPDSALAYSLNFTAVPPAKLGYLTVWPTGQSKPIASTLNDTTGTIVANAALVPAGVGGEISVYPSANTDLVIDVDGYFALSNSAPNPLSLYTLAPCRVVDTRNTIHAFSGAVPFGVLPSSCQVPSAQAFVLNATVIPQGGGRLGYLTLWPDTENQPVVSTLNALDGVVASNMAVVPTVNGWIDAYASYPTDLVLDIFSYFAAIGPLKILNTQLPAGTLNNNYSTALVASGGAAPYTWSIASGQLPPGLNLNTATGAISGRPTTQGNSNFTVGVKDSESTPVSTSIPLSITINSSVTHLIIETTTLASGMQNRSYNAVLAATGGLTPYTWSIGSGTLPVGLTLNSSTGAISGTPSGGGTTNFTVQVSDSNNPQATATAALSIVIASAVPLQLITTSLPPGNVGAGYSAGLRAIGGVYPYTWAIASGNLPSGLTLNSSSGVITGVPVVQGTSTFSIQVSDSETPSIAVSAQFSIIINPGIVIVTTTSLPNGTVGNAYSATLTATGGLLPYGWSIISGTLPTGLTLNSYSGVISGVVTVAGTSNFTVKVVDSEQPPSSATQALSITINPVPWSFTVLHNFSDPDGDYPLGRLVQANDGNFYGTTFEGGSVGYGTLYRITPGGAFAVLHNFSGLEDGAQPYAGVIQGSDGSLYGVDTIGGNTPSGCGSVYKMTLGGTFTWLHRFAGYPTDGCNAWPPLVQANDGNFYGTSYAGGTLNVGTVFRITSSGSLTTLHSFAGSSDGGIPLGGLIQASDGNLYGETTSNGVYGYGTIFSISLSGALTTLHNFNNSDGYTADGGLIQASDGNLYGTTYQGGASSYGTVFKISPGGTFTSLYNFCSQPSCADGRGPYGGLVQRADGNFYGTTWLGGAHGYGSVFEITPSGTLTTLYSFCSQPNCADGAYPYAAPTQGSNGNLYGVTKEGGTNNAGIAFELQTHADHALQPSRAGEVR